MACTLAESPSDPLHRRLRQLRCLRCRFDCYRVERTSSRAGLAPAEVQRLSRRTFSPTDLLSEYPSRMSLPWFKPPDTITCPVCGAKVRVRWDKNSQFQPKPFCDSCGWNVAQARRHFLAYVRQIVIYAPLVAIFAWAVTGIKWGALLMAGWMLVVMAIPIITNLRRLPPSSPAPPLPPLAGIADVRTVTLDAMRPRLN